MPLAPQERIEVPLAEAVDRLGHLALEREPAHLAVGDDVEAGLFLETERRIDGGVLDAFELWWRQLAPCEPFARVEELR